MDIKFSVCNKCKSFDYKELINILVEQYPDAKFDLKCQSFCGPGSIRPFVAVNENFIEADSIDELIESVNKYIKG